jgi:hypothetical protein
MASTAQLQRAAFDRLVASMGPMDVELQKALYNIFLAGWQASISDYGRERHLLETIASHAEGLTIGLDWNNGTAANKHRDKLCAAVKALMELRDGTA